MNCKCTECVGYIIGDCIVAPAIEPIVHSCTKTYPRIKHSESLFNSIYVGDVHVKPARYDFQE